MKVLGLIGSPRVGGNTTTLVNAILEGAAENGAETKVYNLSVLDINILEKEKEKKRKREKEKIILRV